jgi:cyclopropane-fatty-acyl-phospholipid synthase
MSYATRQAISWTEQGLVPDSVIRSAIRRLLRARLADLRCDDIEHVAEETSRFVAAMKVAPIAPLPHKANDQHYELPAEFFAEVLGPQRKYSACFWGDGVECLEQAEEAALEMTCQRAGLADGQQILELGCGWGSLSLYMAARYPRAAIVGVSNSNAQRHYIMREARRRQLNNLIVLTRDMNAFTIENRFDRILSVEMFEHMRNYERLFENIGAWLEPDGRFFLHIFVHRNSPYEFVDRDADDWMTRYFFSGGMMPSAALPLHFQDHLRLQRQWSWSGLHYARTANAWLANLDAHRARVLPILAAVYGLDTAEIRLQRWRIFFMACAELWGFRDGSEWFVSHYLFEPRPRR